MSRVCCRIALREIEEFFKPYDSDMDSVTAPIIGSTKLESITELVEAIHIKLTAEETEQISKPYTPRAVIGHL